MSAGTEEDLIDGEEADADFPELETINRGTIHDYLSGKMVEATPEELEAVQVMSRRLVEDFGYPISHLRTRLHWRVATSPSESKKNPVDITIFSSDKHIAENVVLVVECKRSNRKDGTEQLKKGRHACLPRL